MITTFYYHHYIDAYTWWRSNCPKGHVYEVKQGERTLYAVTDDEEEIERFLPGARFKIVSS